MQYYVSYNSIYIVTDFCGGGELFDYIIDKGFLTESEAAFVMK